MSKESKGISTSKKIIIIVVSVLIAVGAAVGVFFLVKKPGESAVSLTSEMISLEYQSTEYNGQAKMPSVVVKNGETIYEAKEYTVTYANNTNVGTAIVKVTANADSKVLSGSAEKIFQIVKASLAEITAIPSVVYTGESQVPTVAIAGAVSGTDYTISWQYKALTADDSAYVALDTTSNNFVQTGYYKVTATATGSYSGTQTAIYAIYSQLPNVPLMQAKEYNTASQVPTVQIAGLVENTDYTVSWQYRKNADHEFDDYELSATASENFVNAGEYKVTLSGKGIYGGQKSGVYVINPTALPTVTISADATYNSMSNTPTYSFDGNISGSDYIATWKYREFDGEYSEYIPIGNPLTDFVEAGEYELSVVGDGNYTGLQTLTYTINRKDLSDVEVVKADYEYSKDKGKLGVTNNEGHGAVTYKYTNVAADIANLQAASWKDYSIDLNLDVGDYYIYAIVAASKNFNGITTAVKSFNVAKTMLPGIAAQPENTTYTGESQTPIIEFYDDLYGTEVKLVEGKDYQIQWRTMQGTEYVLDADPSKNFVEVGTYFAYVMDAVNGNYKVGEEEYSEPVLLFAYTINKATFSFTVSRADYTEGETASQIVLSGYDEDVHGGELKYYYNTLTSNTSSSAWIEFDPSTKVFTEGYYYLYVKVVNSTNYRDTKSKATTFEVFEAVAKQTLNLTLTREDYFANETPAAFVTNYDATVHGGTFKVYYNTVSDKSTGTWQELSEDTVLPANKYYIYATLTGSSTYNDAESAVDEFNVELADLELTVSRADYTVGNPSEIVTNYVADGDTGIVMVYYAATQAELEADMLSGELEELTETTELTAGTYYMYAVLVDSSIYNDVESEIASFTVSAAE